MALCFEMRLKISCQCVINDSDFIKKICLSKDIPIVSYVSAQQVSDNFFQIKYDIKQLIEKKSRSSLQKGNNESKKLPLASCFLCQSHWFLNGFQ